MKKIALFGLLIVLPCAGKTQAIIDVAESTLKISALGEEEFYFGFAEGDQLIFNFEEVKGKELKEIEIIELPGSSKFMDYKSKKIVNKTLNIARTGIYKFRFANSAISGRICKFRIQRIPATPELVNFNSSVYWKVVYDTTYTPQQERYLVKSDTAVINVLESSPSVSSQNALNGNSNRTVVEFTLPENISSWSYYIGVGKEGQETFEASKNKFVDNAAAVVSSIPGYGPMAALALYGINTFTKSGKGDNVKYSFITDALNASAFKGGYQFYQYKQGNVITEGSQMRTPLTGTIYLGLENDNLLEAINVNIRVTAIQITHTWATRMISKMNINSRQVTYLKN